MKIKKIKEKRNLENQFDIELQGCLDDCTEFFIKLAANWEIAYRGGVNMNGKESVDRIKELKRIFGFYCYRKKTAKTCIYW